MDFLKWLMDGGWFVILFVGILAWEVALKDVALGLLAALLIRRDTKELELRTEQEKRKPLPPAV